MIDIWKITFLIKPRDDNMKVDDLSSELKKRATGPLYALSIESVENGYYSVYYESDNYEIMKGLMKSLNPDFILAKYVERLNC